MPQANRLPRLRFEGTTPLPVDQPFRLPIWGDDSTDWKNPRLLWWVTYEPVWENCRTVNFDKAQWEAFNAKDARRQARLQAETETKKQERLAESAARARREHRQKEDTALWAQEKVLEPNSNVSLIPEGTDPGLDTVATGHYEIYRQQQELHDGSDDEWSGDCAASPMDTTEAEHNSSNADALLHLHDQSGRRVLSLRESAMASLFDRSARIRAASDAAAVGTDAAPPSRHQQGQSPPPALTVDRSLAQIAGLCRSVGLQSYGPSTKPAKRREWLQNHALPAFPQLYTDADKITMDSRSPVTAWSVTYNPLDARANDSLAAVSHKPSFRPFVDSDENPSDLLWDGVYYATPPAGDLAAARKLVGKMLHDASDPQAGPTLGICCFPFTSGSICPALLRQLLRNDSVRIAGIYTPSAAQEVAYSDFAGGVAQDCTPPARSEPELIFVVSNAAGRRRLAPGGDVTALSAFRAAADCHDEGAVRDSALRLALAGRMASQNAAAAAAAAAVEMDTSENVQDGWWQSAAAGDDDDGAQQPSSPWSPSAAAVPQGAAAAAAGSAPSPAPPPPRSRLSLLTPIAPAGRNAAAADDEEQLPDGWDTTWASCAPTRPEHLRQEISTDRR